MVTNSIDLSTLLFLSVILDSLSYVGIFCTHMKEALKKKENSENEDSVLIIVRFNSK